MNKGIENLLFRVGLEFNWKKPHINNYYKTTLNSRSFKPKMQTWFTPGRVLLEQSISDSYFLTAFSYSFRKSMLSIYIKTGRH